MKQNGLRPNNITFPFVAKACSKLTHLRFSQIIHTDVVKSPVWSNVFVQTAMVDMYLKCNQLGDAHSMFEIMPTKDVAAWNSMIVGFAQSGFADRVLCLFRRMRFARIQPDSITIMGLTQVASHSENVAFLKAVHLLGNQIGLEADVFIANTWISAYAKCSDLESAKVVFDGIELGVRTVVLWNTMIAAYSNFEKFIDSLNCYKRMLLDGYRPDSSTTVGLLSSCAQLGARLQGASVHCHGIQLGCDSDILAINTLISMYSKCGNIFAARLLFDSVSCRTCVTWNDIISRYAKKEDLDEPLRLFDAMEAACEKPDLLTMLSPTTGCGQTGSLELGRWINNYSFSNGLRDNTVVYFPLTLTLPHVFSLLPLSLTLLSLLSSSCFDFKKFEFKA